MQEEPNPIEQLAAAVERCLQQVVFAANVPRCLSHHQVAVTCGPALGGQETPRGHEVMVSTGFPPAPAVGQLCFWLWIPVDDGVWHLSHLGRTSEAGKLRFQLPENGQAAFRLAATPSTAAVHELSVPLSHEILRLTQSAEGWEPASGPTPVPIGCHTFEVRTIKLPENTAEEESIMAPSDGAPHAERIGDQIIHDFFPDMHDMIRARLGTQTLPKLALGKPLLDALAHASSGEVFFECGSTIALAALAARKNWDQNPARCPKLRVKTNSSLVQSALYRPPEIETRLLYGNQWLNQEKYAGFFPVGEGALKSATAGDADSTKQVRDAWREQLVTDPWRFAQLFLTASRFHFVCGPFVGSIDNALLKSAFYTCGRRIYILLDGSKLLLNEDLLNEWSKVYCYQVIDSRIDRLNSRLVNHFFAQGRSDKELDEIRELKDRASRRNPHTVLRLPEEWITNPLSNATEHVLVPDSWADAVHGVLSREGGAVEVYVAEPLSPQMIDFEKKLRDAIDDANRSFLHMRNRVRIRLEQGDVFNVGICPEKRCLDEGGSATFKVWKCSFYAITKREQNMENEIEKLRSENAELRQQAGHPHLS